VHVPNAESRKCFVIMPYGNDDQARQHHEHVYRVVKKAVEEFIDDNGSTFVSERFDDHQRAGSFTDQIWRNLDRARVVIADISGTNPNVLYELGIRHARRHGTVLLADSSTPLPADLKDLYVIIYERDLTSERNVADLTNRIRDCLGAIDNPDFALDSPFLGLLASLGGDNQSPLHRSIFDFWVERIDRGSTRHRDIHFSIFAFEYSLGPLAPFRMNGWSYGKNGTFHSKWETKYLRRKPSGDNSVLFEYVYRSWIVGEDRPRSGFGMCVFHADPSTREMVKGSGFYLAGEEPVPTRRNYEMRRLDRKLRHSVSLDEIVLDQHALAKAVPKLAEHLGTAPVRVDPIFTAAEKHAGHGREMSDIEDTERSMLRPFFTLGYPNRRMRPQHRPILTSARDAHATFFDAAFEEAQLGIRENGIPIGSVLVVDGAIRGRGHNRRVQERSPILHGEMDCLANAGRLSPAEYQRAVIYTTLSPCAMCTGAILLYKIPTVVIGENRNFVGHEDRLKAAGVQVIVLDDPRCITIMKTFIDLQPQLWYEDIGERT